MIRDTAVAAKARLRHRSVRGLAGGGLLAALAVIALGLNASSASAYLVSSGAFSGAGAGDGEMLSPGKAEVRLSDGRLLVADGENDRVQVFAPQGPIATFESQLAAASVDAPFDVAIDQETNQVYVADVDGIVRFDSAGALDGTFAPLAVTGPIDFDESSDELIVGDRSTSTVRRYSRTGLPGTTFDGTNGGSAFGNLLDLAVDSTGDLIVVDASGTLAEITFGVASSTVERYSVAGAFEAELGPITEPVAVAVDPTGTDRVLVGGNIAGSYNGQALTTTVFSAAGDVRQVVSLAGAPGYSQVTGLASSGEGGRMYAVTDVDAAERFWGGVTILAYDDFPPAVVTDPVLSNVTSVGVDVATSVDPNGLSTDWSIEYSSDGGSSWEVGRSGNAGNGTEPVAITETLTGLDALTSYLVRVSATGIAPSAAVAFDTPAGPPLAETGAADDISTTGVTLHGRVDPQGTPTEYWFEYGTTIGYGSRTPVAEAVGNDEITVVRPIGGLRPDTTYHYRLVARNDEGSVTGVDRELTTFGGCPNAEIRRVQGTDRLADCRAYEMVSPALKYNGGVPAGHRVSDDGNAAGFLMNAATGAEDGAYPTTPYVARRTPDGWVARSAAPRIRSEHRGASAEVNAVARDFSNDFSKAYLLTGDPLDPADLEPMHSGGVGPTYGIDLYSFEPMSRKATWFSRPAPERAEAYQGGGAAEYWGRSDDERHLVFGVHRSLLMVDPLRPPDPSSTARSIYESVDGQLRLVSILPNGDAAETAAVAKPNGFLDMARADGTEAISADGSRIIWYAESNSPVYMREDGERTLVLSKSQATGSEGEVVEGLFMAASDDASVVYFFSYGTTPLVDGAPATQAIYRWEREGEQLSFVTATGPVVHTTTPGFVPLATPSGDRMYFKSTTALASGAIEGKHNLYVWDATAGELETIAPTSSSAPFNDLRLLLSRDGRYAVYTSRDSLGPDHAAGVNEIYVYDAETGTSECASCSRDGSPNATDAYQRASTPMRYSGLVNNTVQAPRNVTDDGRVFFDTKEALVARDVNGDSDVYEYDDGRQKLITSGRGDGGELVDLSNDGSSVFFTTTNAHTARDVDSGFPDIYVARVNGGFPEPPPEPESCSGAACRDGASAAWPDLRLGTAEPSPPPGASGRRRASLSVTAAKSVRGSRTVVRVRVPAAGRVSVRGGSAIAVSRRAAKAGTVRLSIRLNRKAVRTLARRGSVKAKLRVVYARSGGGSASRTVTVTFKRSKTTNGRGR